MEMPGIEPGASHMRSERSTTELHPQACIVGELLCFSYSFIFIDETTCDQVCFSIALDMPLFVVITKVDKSSPEQVAKTTQAIVDNLLAEKGKVPLPVHNTVDVHTAAHNFREGKYGDFSCLYMQQT